MTFVSAVLAPAVVLAGLVLALAGLVATRDGVGSLRIFLDLLLAGGLLRLTADVGWSALATTAALVAIRTVVVRAVHRSARAEV
ncbi:MAG: hypothetical protein ABIS35_07880 [Terracoccus sp.]